jgi:hypothetical protein
LDSLSLRAALPIWYRLLPGLLPEALRLSEGGRGGERIGERRHLVEIFVYQLLQGLGGRRRGRGRGR